MEASQLIQNWQDGGLVENIQNVLDNYANGLDISEEANELLIIMSELLTNEGFREQVLAARVYDALEKLYFPPVPICGVCLEPPASCYCPMPKDAA